MVADVDLGHLKLSQLQERLRSLKGEPEAEVRALALAASDVLVVREMGVVGGAVAPTETVAQAADRFLAQVWDGKRGCALTEAEVRLAYMQNLGKYKHPPGWSVWQAQVRCCTKPEGCPQLDVAACLHENRPTVDKLTTAMRTAFAELPVGQAADATELNLPESPLRFKHLPKFEQLVADAQASGARQLELVRYSFWQRNVPGFEKAQFRRADPVVEAAAKRAKIGEVLGPLEGEDSLYAVVVAARQPLALGIPKDPTALLADAQATKAEAEIRMQLCLDAAVQERQAYRERLLGGALVVWQASALKGHVSDAAVQKVIAAFKR